MTLNIILPKSMEAINQRIVDRLRFFRVRNGYSQEKLAALIGVKRANYANYESGRQAIPAIVALEASKHLGITPNDYLVDKLDNNLAYDYQKRLLAIIQPTYERLQGINDPELYEILLNHSKSYFGVVDYLIKQTVAAKKDPQ